MINLSIIGSGNVGKHFIALVQNSKDLNLIQWLSRSGPRERTLQDKRG